jgi:hypothetical protein
MKILYNLFITPFTGRVYVKVLRYEGRVTQTLPSTYRYYVKCLGLGFLGHYDTSVLRMNLLVGSVVQIPVYMFK